MSDVIVSDRLSKQYGKRRGVENVNLRVAEGELFGFLGPNGSGKTTTIRLMLGLVRPSSGSSTIFGLDCWRHSSRVKFDVGYLPGDVRLYRWMTADRALRVFSRIRGQGLRAYGEELASRFGLEMDLPVRKMSRGMRQKLGLILTLAHRPRLVVLDEPTSALDPLMQDVLAEELKSLAAAGHTVFFSSHTLSEVDQLCDRVAIVRQGKIVADESLRALRGRARRMVTIRFPDASTANSTAAPEFLLALVREKEVWRGEMTGAADQLVQWAARQTIADMDIGKPELESVFRKYYQSSEQA